MSTRYLPHAGPSTERRTRRARPRHIRVVPPLPVDREPARRTDPTTEILATERPWGEFQQFVHNEQVTVKIITVLPGHRLSLQRHELRGEMWQVLDTPIDITVGDRQWTASPGEVVWVPQGSVHRMGNSGSVPGRVLEVGFGHFDEDDIQRLEDDYCR